MSKRPPGGQSKLVKAAHGVIVEAIGEGIGYRDAAALAGIDYGTLKRWLRGPEPTPAQRLLRAHVRKAKAEAKRNCLRRIRIAGMEPRYWPAAAWEWEHIHAPAEKATQKHEVSVTMADGARRLDEAEAELERAGQEQTHAQG